MIKVRIGKPVLWAGVLLATGFCITAFGAGQIYKTVDEHGNVSYTDQPPPSKAREEVELPPVNQMPAQRITRKLAPPKEAESTGNYSEIFISSPANDSVIGNDQMNIVVQLSLKPTLQAGHLVQFLYNGQPAGAPVAATSYAISALERGSHSISASIQDKNGRVIASATPVTVHVQRHFLRQ